MLDELDELELELLLLDDRDCEDPVLDSVVLDDSMADVLQVLDDDVVEVEELDDTETVTLELDRLLVDTDCDVLVLLVLLLLDEDAVLNPLSELRLLLLLLNSAPSMAPMVPLS